jgi:hypothetical protein
MAADHVLNGALGHCGDPWPIPDCSGHMPLRHAILVDAVPQFALGVVAGVAPLSSYRAPGSPKGECRMKSTQSGSCPMSGPRSMTTDASRPIARTGMRAGCSSSRG